MTGKNRKDNKKAVEVKEEKPKQSVSTAVNEKISLIVFKELKNIPNITYNGFKTSLEAEDNTKYTKKELEKEFKKYQAKKAFNKK